MVSNRVRDRVVCTDLNLVSSVTDRVVCTDPNPVSSATIEWSVLTLTLSLMLR